MVWVWVLAVTWGVLAVWATVELAGGWALRRAAWWWRLRRARRHDPELAWMLGAAGHHGGRRSR